MLMTFFAEKRWAKDVHRTNSPAVMTYPADGARRALRARRTMLAGGWIQDFLGPVVGD